MTENFIHLEESYQTVLDISKTISKSKEVVNQSKNLWNRLKIFSNTLPVTHEYKSLDQSLADISQPSPTVRGSDSVSCYIKENSILKARLKEMQQEMFALKDKVQIQQQLIDSYEEQLVNASKGLSQRKHVDLRLSIGEKSVDTEKQMLEGRLKNISKLYDKQVEINSKLKEKVKEIGESAEDKKIARIEEKILNSNKKMRILTKRLEKTESILSKNASPVQSVRKSCCLGNHRNKPKIKP